VAGLNKTNYATSSALSTNIIGGFGYDIGIV
jgi:hypothetical protein